MLRGGTEIPVGVELTGLFDNDLRCVFAEVDLARVRRAVRHRASPGAAAASFRVVQLLWPDRNGFLPTEVGFDRTEVLAQPVIGDV